MKHDLRHTDDLTDDDPHELLELEERCFGPPEQHRQALRLVPAPATDTKYIVRVWEGNQLVSCLWLTQRSILIDGQPTRAVGVRGVRADPAYRRRGYARVAMEQATNFIWQTLQPELALLISSEMAVPFYQALGWHALTGPVFCAQPEGTMNLSAALPKNLVMVMLPSGGRRPQGTVDLCGFPW